MPNTSSSYSYVVIDDPTGAFNSPEMVSERYRRIFGVDWSESEAITIYLPRDFFERHYW